MSRRTFSLLACALGLLAGAASPATAGPTTIGGCSFTATHGRVSNPIDPRGSFAGEMDVEMFAFSSDGTPLAATVTCFLRGPEGEIPGSRVPVSGTGLIAGGGVVTYEAWWRHGWVQLCQEVDYADPTPDDAECFETQSICRIDCLVVDWLGPTLQEACVTLGEQATDLGVARVEEDGDVYADPLVDFRCWPFDDV